MRFLETTRRAQLPWVLAIHRSEDLPRAASHVLVLEQGKVCFRGKRSDALLTEFLRGTRAEIARDRTVGRGRARSREIRAGKPLIRVRGDIYVEHQQVLRKVDWTLGAGEHWAVLGRNGSGKSTLLRLLHGDLSPALGGVVERSGFPPGTPIEDFKRTVGLLSPELQSDHAREDLSVEEIVMSGRHASIGLNEAPSAADRRAARRTLGFFGLGDFATRRPRELSYGQMRRVLLARAMVNDPALLLLDEPCTGLDTATRAVVLAHLERLARDGVRIVMATHHAADLIPSINRICQLRGGTVTVSTRRTRQP
jgi:molybdate transport system ATP-binding protein